MSIHYGVFPDLLQERRSKGFSLKGIETTGNPACLKKIPQHHLVLREKRGLFPDCIYTEPPTSLPFPESF